MYLNGLIYTFSLQKEKKKQGLPTPKGASGDEYGNDTGRKWAPAQGIELPLCAKNRESRHRAHSLHKEIGIHTFDRQVCCCRQPSGR